MDQLSIEVPTSKSALALFGALAAYSAFLRLSNGRHVVTVELGDEKRALVVLAALDEFLRDRPGIAATTHVSVDGQGWPDARTPCLPLTPS